MTRRKFIKPIFWVGTAIVLLLVLVIALKVNAQNQFSTDIEERLLQEGVPVKQVTIISRIPYEIEISLQSTSADNHLTVDDNWYMQLARREATFSYRISTRLDSYKLTVYNTDNEEIYSSHTYIYPQDLNQQIELKLPTIDALATKEIVVNQLQLGKLTLDRLDINPDVALGGNGQLLIIYVSAMDLETANGSLPIFMGSLLKLLDTINNEYGTYIVLCHLRVVDGNGEILLDYVKDVESGSAQWTLANGVYDNWFPSPSIYSDSLPTPTPLINQIVYPAPGESSEIFDIASRTPTPTGVAYPPPYP